MATRLSEERGKLPIGEIPVDAIFSPVLRGELHGGACRVGQVTDYDRLILEIKTDGTISPHDALSEASRILVRHFTLVAGVTEEEPTSVRCRRGRHSCPVLRDTHRGPGPDASAPTTA